MADFYDLLRQKIRDAQGDPANLRELVYDAARLALKRHINVYSPAITHIERKALLGRLEQAIARVETEVSGSPPAPFSGPERTGDRPIPASDRTGRGSRLDREADLVNSHDDSADDPRGTEEETVNEPLSSPDVPRDRTAPVFSHTDRGDRFQHRSERSPEPFEPHAGPERGDAARQLIIMPERGLPQGRAPIYVVHPDFYRGGVRPKSFGRTLLIAGAVASQILVIGIAAIALYVAVGGRNPLSAGGGAGAVAQAPAAVSGDDDNDSPGPATMTAAIGAATPAAVTSAAASRPAFSLPTSYGVYALSDDRLLELDQIATALVDPRMRSTFQIVKPSKTIIADGKLKFIAYRRDLSTSAPDKVSVRIAARIARSMIFDGNGKPVTAPPQTDTWLIREVGYDLRVSPMRESAEMVMLRPDNEDFAFPPGRYELSLGGQWYDFVVAGKITDSAQCVEGVATGRGPVFYECRTQ